MEDGPHDRLSILLDREDLVFLKMGSQVGPQCPNWECCVEH